MESLHNEQWESCMRLFRDNLTQDQFESWFKPITFIRYTDGEVHVQIPSAFFREHLDSTYRRLIRLTIRHVFGPTANLYYHYQVVNGSPETTVKTSLSNDSSAVNNRAKAANPFVNHGAHEEIDSQLNPRYTFANFCVGRCNELAAGVGMALARNPRQQTYNPLFVFGPPGVGKTHLAQAVGIGIKETLPQNRVIYVTARLFESQYTAANARGRINDFIAFYQQIDTLIIDDIQDLMGKEKTQRTFFHIFNHLHLNGKQLIITSDTAPADLEQMEERLLGRFKWGMTCELHRPDYGLRLDVLRHKAEEEGVELPEDVLEYIAENVTSSFRELEGVMVSLIGHATIGNRPIDLELAREVVANAINIRRHTINFEMIADQVSSFYKVKPDDIFTKSRQRPINDARQMVMYIAKKHTSLPFTTIGAHLSRAHSTVMHAVTVIEERMATEAKLRADVAAIEQALGINQ